jgi:hypothetical protein
MRMIRLSAAILAAAALLMAGEAMAKKQNIRAMGGTNIVPLGIAIDASYDPRLDELVPGYNVINVAVINQSFNIIYLDPEKDIWKIRLAGQNKPIKATHFLRRDDPKAWAEIPERAKGLVGYPLFLPVGARQVVDLFIPDTVDVVRFNELDVYLKSLDTHLEVVVNQ